MDEAFRVIGPHQSALTGRTRQDTRTARLAEARRHVVATDWRPALRVGAGATNSHGGRTRSRRIAAEICGPKKIVEIDRCRSPRRECGRAVTGLARSEGAAAQPRSQSGGPDGSRRAAQERDQPFARRRDNGATKSEGLATMAQNRDYVVHTAARSGENEPPIPSPTNRPMCRRDTAKGGSQGKRRTPIAGPSSPQPGVLWWPSASQCTPPVGA